MTATSKSAERETGIGTAGLSVSVILIVRNGEAFIAEALASVARGTLQPLEILVIDGGSTDRTAEIAGGFDGVTVVPQEGRGIAAAYNQGIDRACGDLIAFISHDDIWHPEKLERQAAYMAAHPDVLYTVTMVEHFLEPGAVVPAGFRRDLLDGPVIGNIMEALVARKAAFDRVGRFDPAFAVGEDTDWFARAKDAGIASHCLEDVLVRKRVHETNSSLNEGKLNTLLLKAMRASIARKRQAEVS